MNYQLIKFGETEIHRNFGLVQYYLGIVDHMDGHSSCPRSSTLLLLHPPLNDLYLIEGLDLAIAKMFQVEREWAIIIELEFTN
jgi:hypothetical protein